MALQTYERELILRLFRSGGWYDLYQLHEELLLSPAQVSSAISKLKDMELVQLDGLSAKLTDAGLNWVMKNRKSLFMSVDRKWSRSEARTEPSVAVGEPYLPRLKSISTDFFNKHD